MDQNNLIINLSDISFAYPGSSKVLDKLNLQFHQGDRLGLIGPNGSGKTTMFHIIMGLLKPSSGTIEIFGRQVNGERDFRSVRERIGLLFQDADDQLFSPTVLEDVTFGPLNLGKSQEEAKDIAQSTLELLGLSGFEDRVTYKLSGGEKKLVSLATVLAMEPEILLLDEPSNGLDDNTKARLMEALSQLDLSYILISHEIDFLSETTDFICEIRDGRIFFDEEVYAHPHYHRHPHGTVPHEHKP